MGMVVIYTGFPTLTPSETDTVVGGVHIDDVVYCRHCIDLLKLEWKDMKYLTNSRAKQYIYNCYNCGRKITKKSANRV